MKIITPYAKMIMIGNPYMYEQFPLKFSKDEGIALLRKCEYAGRVSHRSEDKMTDDSYDKFIRSIVLQHGDFSIIEHASVTVEAVVDRGITHEIVRHRLASYSQESTRYVKYGNIEVLKPIKIIDEIETEIWREACKNAECNDAIRSF